ncbi:alpha/beta hydrolase domain-containing protein 17C-like isoform X2 [Lethenteron reissneri]|uniref:alpha/beta hydrolase domain-containing protein 17C-like isoform X2 n=1 Tax=Lethenteron reissneri TaxID=7753 RepID=UPI002AB73944|nr:alpha/beta hydrolase domain-containing protein 17C-like isoform X2 [Lethenteron reissneri]
MSSRSKSELNSSSSSRANRAGAVREMEAEGEREGPSFRELCWLVCWPPLPSRIVSKLAFSPSPPSYRLQGDGASGRCGLVLTERADWPHTSSRLDAIDVFLTHTRRGNRIACMHVRASPQARCTLLFSHGNAVDLGQMCGFYADLAAKLNCNVFSYDYSGYGASSGKPSERNLYADIDAAFQALRTRYGLTPDKVVLYGQSIGTVPTVDLASRYECAGVVLHSPLASGLRVLFPGIARTYCFDPFPSIEKISKVSSPVLVIHGTEDEVVDLSHGMAIHARCRRPAEPLWVEGAGHNDVVLHAQYMERLQRFLTHEIACA